MRISCNPLFPHSTKRDSGLNPLMSSVVQVDQNALGLYVRVAKLVNALVSDASEETLAGSSPAADTIKNGVDKSDINA